MFRFFPSSVVAGIINISDELLMFDIVKLLCSAANSDSWIITGPTFSNGMEINTQQLLFLTNVFVLFVNNRRLNIATELACYPAVCTSDIINKACMSGKSMKYVASFFCSSSRRANKHGFVLESINLRQARKKKKYLFCRNTDRTSQHLPSLIVLVVSVDVKKHWTGT